MNYYSLDSVYFRDGEASQCNSPCSYYSTLTPDEMIDWFLNNQTENTHYFWEYEFNAFDFIPFGDGIDNAINMKKNIDIKNKTYNEKREYKIANIGENSDTILYMEYVDASGDDDNGRIYSFYRFRPLNQLEVNSLCNRFLKLRHDVRLMASGFNDIAKSLND